MKKKFLCLMMSMLFCMIFSLNKVNAASTPVSAIFGGGPFYENGQSVMDDLKASGFNTVIIWSIHVSSNGDLNINNNAICTNGTYVGNAAWKTQWASLKQAPTSVNRIEVSIGAAGCADFENIKALINSQGTGSNTNLYKNFKALLDATGADAINYDDESCYDVNSAVKFGQMCNSMGYKNVTLCPYTNSGYWSSVKSQLGTLVDRVYLQCYDGGAYNDPSSWQNALGMKVIPGLWCRDYSASGVQSEMSSWYQSDGIAGGFMWLYDDMLKNNLSTASYASAINTACGADNPTPPPVTSSVNVNLASYFNADGFSYDSNRLNGSLCGNYCYSADAAAQNPSYDGVTYQLGSFADNDKNTINCAGQTVSLTQGNYSSIRVIASATNGDKTGIFRINYTDGTYKDVSVTLKDWCRTDSTQKVVETMSQRHNISSGTDDYINNYIFAYYLTPTSGKTVASIKLPVDSNMHIYAMALVP